MLHKVLITKAILIFVFSNHFLFSQENLDNIQYSDKNFVKKIQYEFYSLGVEITNTNLLNTTIANWNKKYNNNEKIALVDLINILDNKEVGDYVSFLKYISIISSSSFKKNNSLEQILRYHYIYLSQKIPQNSQYFKTLLDVFENQIIINTASHIISYNKGNLSISIEEFLNSNLYNSEGTILGTLAIHFNDIELNFKSNNDDFLMAKSNFNLYPDLGLIEGNSAKIQNLQEIAFLGIIEYSFNNFNIDIKTGVIISNDVVLRADNIKNVSGKFEYKPSKYTSKQINKFLFVSNNSNNIISINNKTRLLSGISISGNKLFTRSILNEESELKILIEQNKFLKFKSKKFALTLDKIYSENTYFGFYDNQDSLYHPSIELNYNLNLKTIELLNLKGPLRQTPFYSTYFQVEINSDILTYSLEDKNIKFSILIAPNERPLVVSSRKYFSNNNLNNFTNLDGTNILKVVYSYYKSQKRKDFYLLDLAYYYKRKPEKLENGIINLWRNGLISYDPSIGMINVLPKLRHYFLSHLKKSDYDEMYFESFSEASSNLVYNLLLNQMYFEGVKKIILSKKNNIVIYPKERTVTLLKNRNIKSKGNFSVGKFDFKGVDVLFDYKLFKLQLLEIDTLQILSKTNAKDHYNYLYNIGGDLFINHPKNKSSLKKLANYPYFISDKSTRVYFDMPEEYGVEYDSTFYFSITQFRIDSLDKVSLPKFEFDGVFYSNNILSPLDAKLIMMPDNFFGFIKEIDNMGLPAYDNKIIINNRIQMDSSGLYVKGNFMYQTTSVFSDKIRLFPDSIQGYLDKGFMSNGKMKKSNKKFPDMEFNNLDFVYYNNINEDYLYVKYDSLNNSKISAYGNELSIYGDMYIYPSNVVSEGTLLTKEATLESDAFSYSMSEISSEETSIKIKPLSYSKEILTSDMVSLNYNLKTKKFNLNTTYFDLENFILPYSSLSTSFSSASWDLINKKITFENLSDEIDLSDFYSTNNDFNNLIISSSKGIFDIEQKKLFLTKVPNLQIADAYIVPHKGNVTVLENSQISPLKNAELILDTLNEYHKFIKADVKLISKSKFEGKGIYEYINFDEDTFEIPFSSFELKTYENENNNMFSSTYSYGVVDKSNPILMEPGFSFYGKIELVANNEQLKFDGVIIPSELRNFKISKAILYEGNFTPGDELALTISENDNDFTSSISKRNNGLYFNFFANDVEKRSLVFFNPSGQLSYDSYNKYYLIEPQNKTNKVVYNGNSLKYFPSSGELFFEGKVNLIDNDPNFSVFSSMSANVDSEDSFNISSETFMIIDINLHKSIISNLGSEFVEIIETVGAPLAHDNEEDVLYRLSDLVGYEKTLAHENIILNEYRPLGLVDPLLNSLFVLANFKFSWSAKYNSWYNTSTLNLSNIGNDDINASVDGFLEIKYFSEDDYMVSVFLQPAPEFWIYLNYDGGILRTYSSIESYNSDVSEIGATKDKYIPIMIVDEEYTLDYINNFRLKYFNIKEPYDLKSPSDTFLEDEIFKTITDDDDDGF
jgi:hypothetical protein